MKKIMGVTNNRGMLNILENNKITMEVGKVIAESHSMIQILIKIEISRIITSKIMHPIIKEKEIKIRLKIKTNKGQPQLFKENQKYQKIKKHKD